MPAGQTWNVHRSTPTACIQWRRTCHQLECVYLYRQRRPSRAQVYSTLNQAVTVSGTTYTVNLSPAAVLTAGTYWIEIQANMTFGTQGEWGWTDRTVQSNSPAAWQNPGGGFGICPTWMPKLAVCIPTAGGPDQVYRINGTTAGGGTVDATPTGTPQRAAPITRVPGRAQSRLGLPTQATIAMIASPPLRFHFRSAFMGKPLTVRTSLLTAVWTS